MRQPTDINTALRWHTDHMNGLEPASHDGDPQCGWYKMQLAPNAPWTPVLIWIDYDIDEATGELASDEIIRADVWGDAKDASDIWTWLTPISEQEYDRLTAWRNKTQARYSSTTSIDLSAAPTLPKG